MSEKNKEQQNVSNNSNNVNKKENDDTNQQKPDPGSDRAAISDRSGAGQQQNSAGSPIKT